MEKAPDLSIVLPLFRNRDTVPRLISRLASALAGTDFEIVAVDDGGEDDSSEILLTGAERAGVAVTLLRHPANLGQNAAVLTGLAAARGRTVVVMDADLQDPPEMVPRLVDALEHGDRDLAFGLREGRWAGAAQILASRSFKSLLFFLLQSDLPVRIGLFVAMRRSIRDRVIEAARPGEYLVGHLAALRRPFALVSFPRVGRPGGGSAYSWSARMRLGTSALSWAWRHRPRPFPPAQAVLCAAAAALIAFVLLAGQPFGLQDDGFRYLLSRTWARGAGLFPTFDLLYPPGAYLWYGGWMRLLGEGLWVLRLGQALLVGLTVLLVFRPLHRHGGLGTAWSAGLLLGVIGTGWGKMAAMGAVAAALLSVDTLGSWRPTRYFFLGTGTGLLLGWREDSAVLLGAVTVVSLLISHSPWRDWRRAGLGAAAGFGAWLAVFGVGGEGSAFLRHELYRVWLLVNRLTPAGRTHAAWRVPEHIGSPRDAIAAALPVLQYLPVAFYLVLLAGYLLSRFRRTGWPRITAIAAVLGILYTPQFLWEFPDLYHLRSHLAVLVIVAGAASAVLRTPGRRVLAAAFTLAAAAGFTLIAWQHRTERPALYPVDPGNAIGARLEGGVPPWAGLPFHGDETLIALPWCPGWYAVEAIPPGTRILSAMPRHLSQRNTLQRLRRDLDRSSNRYVIVTGRPGDLVRPIRLIVLKQYRETGSWNGYHLLERRKPPAIPSRRAAAPGHHGKRLPSPSTPTHLLLPAWEHLLRAAMGEASSAGRGSRPADRGLTPPGRRGWSGARGRWLSPARGP
ncbi:MAG: glycosyltransferase [Acidobacteria bacterium]|nr:glycosyltransferase [Acidobacteriota bacterium]